MERNIIDCLCDIITNLSSISHIGIILISLKLRLDSFWQIHLPLIKNPFYFDLIHF